jgi:predicted double-glycine peptidase
MSRPVMLAFASLMTLPGCPSWAVDDPGTPAEGGRSQEISRSAAENLVLRHQTICGINSLYSLLKYYGRPVSFQEVERQVSLRRQGASLLELRDAVGRLGLPSVARRCSPEDLHRCRIPFIAHFRADLGPQSVPDSEAIIVPTGHFVLVVDVNENKVRFIDGTTGELTTFRRERFPVFWSGNILEPIDGAQTWGPWAAVAIFATWTVLGLAMIAARRKSGAAVSLVALAILASPSQLLAVETAVQDPDRFGGEAWRSSENQAANCLYLELSVLGHPVDYSKVKAALAPGRKPISLADLKGAASRLGCRMQVRRSNPAGLARLPMPVIAQMSDREGRGSLAVIIDLDATNCRLIDGTNALLSEISIDDFRRQWSGFVLAASPPRDQTLLAITFCSVVVAAYSFWLMRRSAGALKSPLGGAKTVRA